MDYSVCEFCGNPPAIDGYCDYCEDWEDTDDYEEWIEEQGGEA